MVASLPWGVRTATSHSGGFHLAAAFLYFWKTAWVLLLLGRWLYFISTSIVHVVLQLSLSLNNFVQHWLYGTFCIHRCSMFSFPAVRFAAINMLNTASESATASVSATAFVLYCMAFLSALVRPPLPWSPLYRGACERPHLIRVAFIWLLLFSISGKIKEHCLGTPAVGEMCVCVFSSHPFWTSSSLDVPAGVTQEEGHTGFLIHLPSAVRALIFVARRIQPFLSLVDREVEFCVLTN